MRNGNAVAAPAEHRKTGEKAGRSDVEQSPAKKARRIAEKAAREKSRVTAFSDSTR